ncbi:sphinganine C4-monooxygenase 1-like [Ananas comosus]|uniref:aldehyde oxygenase (deformylating) n=1 Tax=Ananas comosus TaxID=4615 RepID=A0A6P5G0G3_ANACO|nr:sphinganine C4-monooxygenase 1-like [Ananas comosus]
MGFIGSDDFYMMFAPVVVYWAYSGMYEVLSSRVEKYRLHSRKEEETKNLASKKDVVKGVLLQQAIQAAIAFTVLQLTGDRAQIAAASAAATSPLHSLLVLAQQFLVAMFVFDAWQYFIHRYMHSNRQLYRQFHSWHHRVVAPYAFAAQYNHPVDGVVTETLAGAVAYFISGMSPRTAAFFFSVATVKGIDDHCGLMLPWNPFHAVFRNNTAYHDIHHQLAGSKCNFSQPFFVMWDRILGTYAPYTLERREGGGFEARLVRKDKVGHDS